MNRRDALISGAAALAGGAALIRASEAEAEAAPPAAAKAGPYVPVEMPNGSTLPWERVDGAKQFHLVSKRNQVNSRYGRAFGGVLSSLRIMPPVKPFFCHLFIFAFLPASLFAAKDPSLVRRAVELPDGTDVAKVAAAMNPAMSSWVALRRRVPIESGQSVLVLGATGNAGLMAVQIARLLGAGRVVGAGRDPGRLDALTSLGADEVVPLTDDQDATDRALGAAAGDADIVIDYVWGRPAERAIMALLVARADRSRAMNCCSLSRPRGPTASRTSRHPRDRSKRC